MVLTQCFTVPRQNCSALHVTFKSHPEVGTAKDLRDVPAGIVGFTFGHRGICGGVLVDIRSCWLPVNMLLHREVGSFSNNTTSRDKCTTALHAASKKYCQSCGPSCDSRACRLSCIFFLHLTTPCHHTRWKIMHRVHVLVR